MSTNPNDAIQSLSRMIAAAARLMASMHLHGKPVDFNEELDHMQANLDRIRAEVEGR